MCASSTVIIWPTKANFRDFIDYYRAGDSPLNSRAVQLLMMKMQERSEPRGASDVLLELAMQPGSSASEVLASAGFNVSNAIKECDLRRTPSGDNNWFEIFQQAQGLAAELHSEDTEPEHVLLAILKHPDATAHQLLSALKVDQLKLETELIKTLKQHRGSADQ